MMRHSILPLALALFPAAARAASTGAKDDGTRLSVTTGAPALRCTDDGSGGDVELTFVVSSTAAADRAALTASIDGGAAFDIGAIASGNKAGGGGWNFAGRIKTSDVLAFSTFLANGDHSIVICATQAGAGGRLPKGVCSAPVAVSVDCALPEDACADTAFFGDLVGNQNLCSATGAIPLHIEGDFGDDAVIRISGPNGFALSDALRRDGDSCTYQYLWKSADGNNGGAGAYVFNVSGNGQSASFTRSLACGGLRLQLH